MAQKITPRRNLFESERRFRLLVEGVVDYAIYMLDPSGIVSNWNAGARRIKGYEAAEVVGRHFEMFYLPEDRAAGMPARSLANRARERQVRGRRLAPAQGWHEIPRLRRHRRDLRSGRTDRFCQDHARHYRASQCPGGARAPAKGNSGCWSPALRTMRSYMLDPNGIVTNWNIGGQRIKGYLPEEIIGQHFSRFYSEADQAAGRPARALQTGEGAGPLRRGRLARPQGRHLLLGQRRDRCDPR